MTDGLGNIPGRSLLLRILLTTPHAVRFSKICQMPSKELPASAKTRHDRALWYAKRLLDLLILELINIREQDDFAVSLGEFLESRTHIFIGEVLRNRRFVNQRLFKNLIAFVGELEPEGFPAMMLDHVKKDFEQPRPAVCAEFEPVE